ncbi:MAG TPA: hypothetical protein VEB22_12405 [Phycisphaerales bacterium]|nr:hypothetical protein [Phycisphaerales bacterium]
MPDRSGILDGHYSYFALPSGGRHERKEVRSGASLRPLPATELLAAADDLAALPRVEESGIERDAGTLSLRAAGVLLHIYFRDVADLHLEVYWAETHGQYGRQGVGRLRPDQVSELVRRCAQGDAPLEWLRQRADGWVEGEPADFD